MDSIFNRLSKFSPIHDYKFGHTPFQVENFQVASQQGSPEFTYWHHVLQLQSLFRSIRELYIDRDELLEEIKDAKATWPFWTKRIRKRKLPKLQYKLELLDSAAAQKEREAECHFKIIDEKYPEFVGKTEEQLFESEKEYWTIRLGRQLFCSHLSRLLAVDESALSAVLALPETQQKEVLALLNTQKQKVLNQDDSKQPTIRLHNSTNS